MMLLITISLSFASFIKTNTVFLKNVILSTNNTIVNKKWYIIKDVDEVNKT